MASLCFCHLMGLLSLFMADGFKLPDLWLLVQDGPRAVALPSLSQWNGTGQTGHESPPLVRVKREDKKMSNHSSGPVPTCCTESATIIEATTKQTLLEKVVTVTEAFVESTTEPLTDYSTSLDLLEEVSTEVAATTTEVAATTEVATTKSHTASSHRADGQVGLSTISTGTSASQDLHANMGSTAPQGTSKEEARPSKAAATLTKAEKALTLFNTTFSPTLATRGDSTTTVRHLSGSTGPDLKQKPSPVNTTSASSKAATRSSGTPPPSSGTPPTTTTTTTTLVRKCLLGIFLLALIASAFIITTAILATMLWRQKRAYKMSRGRHPTEMVCISSLLAAEEAEEEAERRPRVKRMKMLGCDGSETDIDNLTLNSFLP